MWIYISANNVLVKFDSHFITVFILFLLLYLPFLVNKDDVHYAVAQNVDVTHILIDCTHLCAVRQRYFRVDTLKELSEIVDSRNIIAFIKDINFYHCM